ncbi:MAG: ATP-binding cassette domain-containing protein [Acidobacteriota bacterium]|nr:MAG: ATP-binding cassette domain-containing protein [Acidobacteriota bacterium]
MEPVRSTAPSTGTGEEGIRIEGVTHVYRGGTRALDGVDLEIGRGLFGLLGPNGAGKSTLMRIICTLLIPTAGTVQVNGYDVVRQRRRVRALLGYLPQEFGAWRLHRVEEVLDTLARLSGQVDHARRRQRVGEVLAAVGLDEVADRKVKKLSGGMVRRLGVAQALVHEPEVLVVDEPTVGLDPEERIKFRQLMAELATQRVIVLSTHIVADLGPACRDLALLDEGKIVYRGDPAALRRRAKGRVFELAGEPGREPTVGESSEEVSRSTRDGRVVVRAVSASTSLPAGALAVEEPTLEEAYLAFMLERGRVELAMDEGET